MRAILLNGIPTSLLAEVYEYMTKHREELRKNHLDIAVFMEFEVKNVEWLKEILNTSIEVINTIRHESTKNLVLSLIERKEKVKEQQFVSINDIGVGDVVILIAPRKLIERGKEQSVTWEDLVIIKLRFISSLVI